MYVCYIVFVKAFITASGTVVFFRLTYLLTYLMTFRVMGSRYKFIFLDDSLSIAIIFH